MLRRLDAALTPLFMRRRDAMVDVRASGVSSPSLLSLPSSPSASFSISLGWFFSSFSFPPSLSLSLTSINSEESLEDKTGLRLSGERGAG
jgi:hypothetical protein